MATRTLPAPTRNSGAVLPAISRRRTALPAGSHRLLTARDVPPLPDLRVHVAADVVAVVQLTVAVRTTARVTAGFGGEVTATAAVRADGGTKEVDADHDIEVTATAAVFVRYHRAATVTANVAAVAAAGAGARPQFGGEVTASAVVDLVRTTLAAVKDVSVTATAEIVAYGGQVPVDADKAIEVTASADAFGRIYRDALVAIEGTATAERVIRMAAAAVQNATVTTVAGIKVPVAAQVTATVTASAEARLAFEDAGMDKTSASAISGTNLTVIPGFVARPGSTVVSNRLTVASGSGAKTIRAVVVARGAATLSLYHNSTVLQSMTISGGSNSTYTFSGWPVTLTAGDTAHLTVQNTFGGGGSNVESASVYWD